MTDSILITGGAGFIGSNFLHYIRSQQPERELINLDKLTYAGNLENLKSFEDDPHYQFVKADVAKYEEVEPVFGSGVEAVVHFAAETHVDRSIEDSRPFVQTNVEGTRVMLELAKKYGVKKYIQVSTDEVYGELGAEGKFTLNTSLAPSNPYSASKAGADLLAGSFQRTFGLPVSIVRCSNNYGPYQFPEKLIPLMIANALQDKKLPVYGDGANVRDWIYVKDFCRGIYDVLEAGEAGEVYHFGGDCELTNLEVVKQILTALDKPEELIEFVEDRPGHDFRYAMDFEKTTEALGWKPEVNFKEGLQKTINWYL
jgi:dTDP-glucose 4,6-dehydratase